MKKLISLLVVVMVLALTGCSKNITETVTLEATVVSCEKGSLHQNTTYSSQATTALINGDYTNYTLYSTLATSTGYYDYKITVSIGDEFQTVVRNNSYEVGNTIYVEKITTYNESNELIKTVYR
mgnify:CR=1 FL=1